MSRPPYLTALALWPKGDAWGGGGLFVAKREIALDHLSAGTNLAAGFSLPRWLSVTTFSSRYGSGQDVCVQRSSRDGWSLAQAGTEIRGRLGAQSWIKYDPPILYRKRHPVLKECALKMTIHGIHERNGPWYVTEHSIARPEGTESLGRSDWADWAPSGDLLYAKDGRLFRLRFCDGMLAPFSTSVELIDLSGRTFRELESPPEMRAWPERPRP